MTLSFKGWLEEHLRDDWWVDLGNDWTLLTSKGMAEEQENELARHGKNEINKEFLAEDAFSFPFWMRDSEGTVLSHESLEEALDDCNVLAMRFPDNARGKEVYKFFDWQDLLKEYYFVTKYCDGYSMDVIHEAFHRAEQGIAREDFVELLNTLRGPDEWEVRGQKAERVLAIIEKTPDKDNLFFGIRATDKVHAPGDKLDCSRVWDDGNPTGERLPGTSSIGIPFIDCDHTRDEQIDAIADAIEAIKRYPFGHVFLIAGDLVGGDWEEWVISGERDCYGNHTGAFVVANLDFVK